MHIAHAALSMCTQKYVPSPVADHECSNKCMSTTASAVLPYQASQPTVSLAMPMAGKNEVLKMK